VSSSAASVMCVRRAVTRPGKDAQRLLPHDDQDDRGAGDVGASEAARNDRTVRLAAFGTGVLRTNALEALVIASFVRGLSVRDAEATLTEALGEQATVSKSAVSRICAQLKEQYETWSRRRLDEVTLDYLFLDASHFKYHANAGAEPVLAAGCTRQGPPGCARVTGSAGKATRNIGQAARAARVHTKTCSGAEAYTGCSTNVLAPRHDPRRTRHDAGVTASLRTR